MVVFMPFLTLCMITRNEALGVGDAIESCKGVADEVILVDTGSTDGTPEIASQLGARVLHQPWQDSFSAPRNLGFEHVKTEWLFVLDCDEKLRPESRAVLLETCRENK